MKISKDELLKKISEKVTDEDVQIELIEDVTDSFEVSEVTKDEYEVLKSKYDDLKAKYKERFLSKSEEKEDEETEDEEPEDEEKEVVDVKEIFKEEEK